ncbi:unnamed protein product, partial [Iphiclides podalirius]
MAPATQDSANCYYCLATGVGIPGSRCANRHTRELCDAGNVGYAAPALITLFGLPDCLRRDDGPADEKRVAAGSKPA